MLIVILLLDIMYTLENVSQKPKGYFLPMRQNKKIQVLLSQNFKITVYFKTHTSI